jgi:hypothetical protein
VTVDGVPAGGSVELIGAGSKDGPGKASFKIDRLDTDRYLRLHVPGAKCDRYRMLEAGSSLAGVALLAVDSALVLPLLVDLVGGAVGSPPSGLYGYSPSDLTFEAWQCPDQGTPATTAVSFTSDDPVKVALVVDKYVEVLPGATAIHLRYLNIGTTPFTYQFTTGQPTAVATWDADDDEPDALLDGQIHVPAVGRPARIDVNPPSGFLFRAGTVLTVVGALSAIVGGVGLAFADDGCMPGLGCPTTFGLAGGGAAAMLLGIWGIRRGTGTADVEVDDR